MKLTIILPIMALATSASARNVHVMGDLKAREIDPATMDPTKLSILSVLKTAIPTLSGTELAVPTGDTRIGDYSAQWIQNLPPDFLTLLAQMYPTTHTSETAAPATSISDAAVSETAAASSDAISSVSEETAAASSDASSSVSEETAAASSDASSSVPQETAAASSHASSSASQETASASVGATTNAPVSQTALTNTLQTVPTATAIITSNGTQSTTTGTPAVSNPVVSNSAVSNSAVSTGEHSTSKPSKPSKPSSSQSASSAGAKNTVGTGSWSVAVGLSVAALFCLLA